MIGGEQDQLTVVDRSARGGDLSDPLDEGVLPFGCGRRRRRGRRRSPRAATSSGCGRRTAGGLEQGDRLGAPTLGLPDAEARPRGRRERARAGPRAPAHMPPPRRPRGRRRDGARPAGTSRRQLLRGRPGLGAGVQGGARRAKWHEPASPSTKARCASRLQTGWAGLRSARVVKADRARSRITELEARVTHDRQRLERFRVGLPHGLRLVPRRREVMEREEDGGAQLASRRDGMGLATSARSAASRAR